MTPTLLAHDDVLSDAQRRAWRDAVAAVDEVARSTDTASTSKPALAALQQLVRTHPVSVVNELHLVDT